MIFPNNKLNRSIKLFWNIKNKNLEEKLFKQDNLVDRLTRDKISLTSELESYKKKCNSIDLDTHQVELV